MSVELGYINGCFGVNGWLKVFSYCEPRSNIFNYSEWFLDQTPVVVTHSKINNKNLIVKLANINSKNDAELLIGKKITIVDLPKLPNNEYYWHELIGLTVINKQKSTLGVISEILNTNANDVLVVKNSHNKYLIPYTIGIHVISVDLKNKQVIVDWSK